MKKGTIIKIPVIKGKGINYTFKYGFTDNTEISILHKAHKEFDKVVEKYKLDKILDEIKIDL